MRHRDTDRRQRGDDVKIIRSPEVEISHPSGTLRSMVRLFGPVPYSLPTRAAIPILCLAVSSCGLLKKPPAPRYESAIMVEADPGTPLAGAKVTYQKKTVGISDKKGRVRVSLKGPEGQVFALAVQCPSGHRSPDKPVAVTLRKIARGAIPQYKVSCPRSVRKVVVAVRAKKGANLPVTYLGSEIARTDQSGAAHILLEVTPNQSFQLKLDTSSNKRLIPASPVTSFEVKDEDAVLALEQDFTLERPKYRGTYRKKSKGPTPL